MYTMFNKSFTYADGSIVKSDADGNLRFINRHENILLSDDNKAQFNNNTGETVVEYAGLTTDKEATRSIAKASFEPEGSSPLHYHKHLTEDYYVFSGEAHVTIDETAHVVAVGEHIRISPGQQHQVFNQSKEQPLHLLVLCEPAWRQADHLLITNANISTPSVELKK